MVSKNQIKLITSLHHKKFRLSHQLFIAEGEKIIHELLNSDFELHSLFATEEIFPRINREKFNLVSNAELKKISALTVPNNCLAVFHIPIKDHCIIDDLIVALDDIRDPGNFGTIIRLCDWFGVKQIICSEKTVDLYNPKVIQATMGSVSRVSVVYGNLAQWLSETELPVFGTFMEGANIYKSQLPLRGIIVMGNEANGISKEIEQIVQNKISIPRFGNKKLTESLNVATATAIILSEFRRSS